MKMMLCTKSELISCEGSQGSKLMKFEPQQMFLQSL